MGPDDLDALHIEQLADLVGRASGDHRHRPRAGVRAGRAPAGSREGPRDSSGRANDRRERPVQIEEHAGPRRAGRDRRRNLRHVDHAAPPPRHVDLGVPRGAVDAEDRPRPGLEALLGDEPAASVADPVRPLLDLLRGPARRRCSIASSSRAVPTRFSRSTASVVPSPTRLPKDTDGIADRARRS